MLYKLLSLSLLVIACAHFVGCRRRHESSQNQVGPNAPILKIAVMADGHITVDGSPATLESLRHSLTQLAQQKGSVWYYREAAQSEPPPQATQVIEAVVENRLPITFSTRADYSDAIRMVSKLTK